MPALFVAMIFVLLFAHPYYFLYIQTDEGLDAEARLKRAKNRQMLYMRLNEIRQIYGGQRPLPLPKQDRIDAERARRRDLNMSFVAEWRLASEEELETLEPYQLQRRLDGRNFHCDLIAQLLDELNDPIMRASSHDESTRRSTLMDQIRELRLRPLREAEELAQQRVKLILDRAE